MDDKIPISCVREADREIIEKFGIDRCKKLDWELINKSVYYNRLCDIFNLGFLKEDKGLKNLYNLFAKKYNFSPKNFTSYKTVRFESRFVRQFYGDTFLFSDILTSEN